MIKKFFKFMPINQRFIPNLHRKTIISISIFRNQHPYLLFTNSKILNSFVNRQHILLPDWNHLALYSFFYTINEQISNFAQTYPTNLKASSNEALLFMRRYRFANCSCFSCCFKDAYPSSNVQ